MNYEMNKHIVIIRIIIEVHCLEIIVKVSSRMLGLVAEVVYWFPHRSRSLTHGICV